MIPIFTNLLSKVAPLMDAQALTSRDLSMFHDAELCQLGIERTDSTISLRLRTENGNVLTLEFLEIFMFRANDVMLQNVVSRLRTDTAGVASAEVATISRWVCSVRRNELIIPEHKFSALLDDVHSLRRKLCHLEPSVGGESVSFVAKSGSIMLKAIHKPIVG